jgi:hypothetical protein
LKQFILGHALGGADLVQDLFEDAYSQWIVPRYRKTVMEGSFTDQNDVISNH